MTRVLITCRQMQESFGIFEPQFSRLGLEPFLPLVTQAMSETDLIEIIEPFQGVIAGDDSFTASVLENAPNLKVISKWGIGIDGIDLEAARLRGIRVTNTPAVFDSEVADVSIGYIVMLARQLHRIDTAVRAGDWWKPAGLTLAGQVLGVVGLGSIGMAVVRRAQAMDMVVTGFDVVPEARDRAAGKGVRVMEFDDLLRSSDIISLHCPLTRENGHILDGRAFGLMRDGAFLVNTARGRLVEEGALVEALGTGRVAGAALDVFEQEPTTSTNPLLQFPQVVLGSHNASNTVAAVERVSAMAVKNLIEGLGVA